MRLKCFISSSYDTDISLVKEALLNRDVEVFDIYDFSIGESIQQILKRKLRQADFALFVFSHDLNVNVTFEMGVCEGLGKQYFVLVEKNSKVPLFAESQLSIRTDLLDEKLVKVAVDNILKLVESESNSKISQSKNKARSGKYSKEVLENLQSYLEQIKHCRINGSGKEVEYIVEEVFKSLKLTYISNESKRDKGVDFAIWNDELGKILGNPIIVEVKAGLVSEGAFSIAESQINTYIQKAEVKVGLLLYLDKRDKRHKVRSSLMPLVISYDIEDLITDLLTNSFENLILAQRNKIAHGVH